MIEASNATNVFTEPISFTGNLETTIVLTLAFIVFFGMVVFFIKSAFNNDSEENDGFSDNGDVLSINGVRYVHKDNILVRKELVDLEQKNTKRPVVITNSKKYAEMKKK